MKLIFTTRQIKELDGVSKADRRELFRLNSGRVFRHWQGWVSALSYAVMMSFIVFSWYIAPDDIHPWLFLIMISPIIITLGIIYRVLHLTAIAPYIARDVIYWTKRGFITKEIKSVEHAPPEGHGQGSAPLRLVVTAYDEK